MHKDPETPQERPKDTRNGFYFRLTLDQQDALDLAKAKAVRMSGFAPSNKAIGDGMLSAFCERYGILYPTTPPRCDRHIRKHMRQKAA